MSVPNMPIDLPDETATQLLGSRLAPLLVPGMVVFLRGDLGAGKTSLARATLRALGFAGKVKSPTYTLVELYTVSRLNLYHFDFYRFNDPREWADAGMRDLFGADNVCLVEWPEKAAGLLPAADLTIHLHIAGEARRANITAESELGRTCLQALQKHYGDLPS